MNYEEMVEFVKKHPTSAAILPGNAYLDMRLKGFESRVLILLCSRANPITNDWFSLDQGEVASLMKSPRQSVNRAIRRLTEFGYIEKKRVGEIHPGHCVYRIIYGNGEESNA